MLRDGDPVTASDDTPRDPGSNAETFRDDLRAATALLEQVIADRSQLVHVPFEERQRFLDAVGHVFHPDARARRANLFDEAVVPGALEHPHDEVLDRFATRGITLRRTDLEGAVSATLFADGAVR